ncbi:MAG: glycosyl transferase family 1 [Mizugakiibacter sp.]|uniref:glycosyl transferase family 1 n=1 Tax=Mizugakiibacter sp. TaxID=1972610 RepID=UPI0031BD3ADB|nr:glycosyl transferase family 1 [Xanthomonadaceae bacterium]
MATVNLVFWDNGFGLSRDFRLLADALHRNACEVTVTALDLRDERRRRSKRMRAYVGAQRLWCGLRRRWRPPQTFDLNIMFEHLWPDQLIRSRCNVALPNPEWFDRRDQHFLPAIDRVWAKTRNAAAIFGGLGCVTSWVGFHSDDRFDPSVPRERKFFHLAGGSRIKGTDRLLAVWRRHPEWPTLTVLQHPREAHPGPSAANIEHRLGYLDVSKPTHYAELKRLQNSHVFHLCTSETDGWGHYLVEALGVGAATVTVDAPPMNELVTPERGLLVPYEGTGNMALATTYYFDERALEDTVERALALSDAELCLLGERGRAWFVENRNAFVRRIGDALSATLH